MLIWLVHKTVVNALGETKGKAILVAFPSLDGIMCGRKHSCFSPGLYGSPRRALAAP